MAYPGLHSHSKLRSIGFSLLTRQGLVFSTPAAPKLNCTATQNCEQLGPVYLQDRVLFSNKSAGPALNCTATQNCGQKQNSSFGLLAR